MAPLSEKNNNAIITPSTKADKGSKVTKKASPTRTAGTKTKTDVGKGKEKSAKKVAKGDDVADWDVSGITLPGEDETEQLPVYDTCNDLRTKINNYIKNAPKKINSKAAFVRKINEATSGDVASVASLNTFLKKKGPVAGANSPVCYASYVYFEKLRVMQGKSKSKKREEMEDVHGADGMRLHNPQAQGLILQVNEGMTVDKYGKVEIVLR